MVLKQIVAQWVEECKMLHRLYGSNYGIDVALQKNFLKNNAASLTLSVNDVFRSRRYDVFSESAFFIQNGHRLNDVLMMRLNFSFRFRQMDLSLLKRIDTKYESMQNAIQGMELINLF